MNEIFFVYILCNIHRNVFYVGVTNDLIRRVFEHKNKLVKGFSYKYNVDTLVYYEAFGSIELAILHEKRIKRWSRPIKCDAIHHINPEWKDLYDALTNEPSTNIIENVGRHPGLVQGSPSTHSSSFSQDLTKESMKKEKNHSALQEIPGQARDDSATSTLEHAS